MLIIFTLLCSQSPELFTPKILKLLSHSPFSPPHAAFSLHQGPPQPPCPSVAAVLAVMCLVHVAECDGLDLSELLRVSLLQTE